MVEIIVALITLAGVIITVVWGNKKNAETVKQQTDLTLYRISELEKKQDKHNTLIERMFKVEDRLNIVDEKMKVANHRLDDLEHKND